MNYQERIAQIQQERKTLESRLEDLKWKHTLVLNLRLKELLSQEGINFKDDEIEISTSSIHFYKKKDDYRSNIFTLYFRDNYHRVSDGIKYSDIELSYYTTGVSSSNFDFEIDRIQLLGKIATFLKNRKQDVLDILTQEYTGYSNEVKADRIYEQMTTLRREETELEGLELTQKKDLLLNKLRTTGVAFGDTYQVLQLKFNYEVHALSIKVTSISTSGKTCTVECTTPYSQRPIVEERVDLHRLVNQLYMIKNKIIN
jgi:hypothetical protein